MSTFEPPECRFCGAVYGHDPECRSMVVAQVRRLEQEIARLREVIDAVVDAVRRER